jgi:uncharacterized protein (UPF0248 family)
MEQPLHPSVQDDSTDDLAFMAIPPVSGTDEVVALQPRQNPVRNPVSSDDSSCSDGEGPSLPKGPRLPSKARAKKARKVQTQVQSAARPAHGALRPAKDILSRIRHDPTLDEKDFIIGYRDRHEDVMELPVKMWKGDVTDDDFIPQHRILYYRRKEDGVKVWDRAERLDLLFGSGKGGISEVNLIGSGDQPTLTEDEVGLAKGAEDKNPTAEATRQEKDACVEEGGQGHRE